MGFEEREREREREFFGIVWFYNWKQRNVRLPITFELLFGEFCFVRTYVWMYIHMCTCFWISFRISRAKSSRHLDKPKVTRDAGAETRVTLPSIRTWGGKSTPQPPPHTMLRGNTTFNKLLTAPLASPSPYMYVASKLRERIKGNKDSIIWIIGLWHYAVERDTRLFANFIKEAALYD